MPRTPSSVPANGRRRVSSDVAVSDEPYEYVNHPPHYTPETIECIQALQVILTRQEYIGFLRGTIIKYQWRMGTKPDTDMLQDTQKMQWYATRLAEVLSDAMDES